MSDRVINGKLVFRVVHGIVIKKGVISSLIFKEVLKKNFSRVITLLNVFGKRAMKQFFVVLFAVAMVGFIGSCRAKHRLPPNSLLLSLTSNPKTFNYVTSQEASSTVVLSRVFEGLTMTDGVTKEVQPLLAEKWQISPNGQTWKFFLRQDVTWSDGQKFTADDVLFTFNDLIYNPDIPTSTRSIFLIDNQPILVKKVDDFTVIFELPKPFVPFLRSLGTPIMPKHLLADSVSKGDFSSTWGINTPPEQIVGTGPYRIVQFNQNERILLESNPRYWRRDEQGNRLPYIKRIFYFIVSDRNAQRAMFENGMIDAYSMEPKDWGVLKPKEEVGNYRVMNLGPGPGSTFVIFNLNQGSDQNGKPFVDPIKQKIFANIHFRRAIAHAIDKPYLIKNYLYGLGKQQWTEVWSESPFYYKDVHKYPFDLVQAQKQLALAGLTHKDDEGYLLGPDGKRFQFTILSHTENEIRVKITNQLVAELRKIGLRVNVRPILFNNLVQKLSATFDWEATIIGLTGGIEPHSGRNVWHSSGPLHMWNPAQKSPATSWEAEIDRIFDQGASIVDHEQRKKLYFRWQQIVSEQLPLIYTVKAPVLYAVRNRFQNLQPTAYGGLFHNLEHIKINNPEAR